MKPLTKAQLKKRQAKEIEQKKLMKKKISEFDVVVDEEDEDEKISFTHILLTSLMDPGWMIRFDH